MVVGALTGRIDRILAVLDERTGLVAARIRVPRRHWPAVLVVLGYLLLSLGGVTTSSLGAPELRVDPDAPGVGLIGPVQEVRTDEYRIATPINMSIMVTGDQPSMGPLAASAGLGHRYPTGPIQAIVFWDTWTLLAGHYIPPQMAFAAHWWLPHLMVLLLLPIWFVQMGANRHLGWLAAGLIVLSPANWWWSMQLAEALQFPLAAAVAILAAHRRFVANRWRIGMVLCLVAGLMMAGLATRYPPWTLVIGITVLLASCMQVLTSRTPLRTRLWSVGAAAAFSFLLLALVLWESREALIATAGTVYPGDRREGARAIDFGVLFGAPFMSSLGTMKVIDSNASEVTTAYNVLFLVIPVVMLASGYVVGHWRKRSGLYTVLFFGLVWLSWCVIELGNFGARIPVMAMVTPPRAAQSVGAVGIIAFCLVLSYYRRDRGWRTPLLAAAIVALVSVHAGSLLWRQTLDGLQLRTVYLASILAGLAVAVLLRWPRRWPPIALTLLLAAGVAIPNTPIQIGLGDLGNSELARHLQQVGAQARADGVLWASDQESFDSLMIANGVPSLSGFQRSGPVLEQWHKLDPDDHQKRAWNRGGSYISMDWTSANIATRITTSGFDRIYVLANPCRLAEEFPELAVIATPRRMNLPCLGELERATWNGDQVHLYQVVR